MTSDTEQRQRASSTEQRQRAAEGSGVTVPALLRAQFRDSHAQLAAFRRWLDAQEAGHATHVRIDDIRRALGWTTGREAA